MPKTRNLDNSNEFFEKTPKSLRESISDYLDQLGQSTTFCSEAGRESAEAILGEFKNEIEQGRLTPDYLVDVNFELISTDRKLDEASFKLSIANAALADIAESRGNQAAAWPYLINAYRHLEKLLTIELLDYYASEKRARSDKLQAGAKIRHNDRTALAKLELTRLLETKHGGVGWKDLKTACNSLEKPLQDFITINDIDINIDSAKRTIARWIKKYDEIRKAFEKNLAANFHASQ